MGGCQLMLAYLPVPQNGKMAKLEELAVSGRTQALAWRSVRTTTTLRNYRKLRRSSCGLKVTRSKSNVELFTKLVVTSNRTGLSGG